MKIRDGIPENIRNKMYEDNTGNDDAMIYLGGNGAIYVHSDSDKEYTVEPEKKHRGRKKAAK